MTCQVGSSGQLLEYYKEFKDVPPRHHTTHFYPLYPGRSDHAARHAAAGGGGFEVDLAGRARS